MQKFASAGPHRLDDELRIVDAGCDEEPRLGQRPIEKLQRLQRRFGLLHVHNDHLGIGFDESPDDPVSSRGTVLGHFQLHASHPCGLCEGSQRLASFGLGSENSNRDLGQANLHSEPAPVAQVC